MSCCYFCTRGLIDPLTFSESSCMFLIINIFFLFKNCRIKNCTKNISLCNVKKKNQYRERYVSPREKPTLCQKLTLWKVKVNKGSPRAFRSTTVRLFHQRSANLVTLMFLHFTEATRSFYSSKPQKETLTSSLIHACV